MNKYASGIRLPDCSKLAVNWKNDNDVTIFEMKSSSNFFDFVSFLLSSLVTDPSFTDPSSGVMTIFVYKAFTRNPEIGKKPVVVLPNI